MTEYVCVTLHGRPGEPEAGFKSRLVAFWTHLLRTRPDDYAKVYAEARAFGSHAGHPTRAYMVEAEAVGPLTAELAAAGLAFAPVDADDTYTRYEAASPEWFQIPH